MAACTFLVTPLTISSWTARLDEEGSDALVRLPEPVSRFPDFVGYVATRLKILSDQGRQFVAKDFRRWCRRRGIRQRFGAIGQYGSLAVIERCIRTIKTECTRQLVAVPLRLTDFERELGRYFSWYNGHRPHTRLGGATSDEVSHRGRRANRAPRFEPRPRWPRHSICAPPRTRIRGQPGVRLDLAVRYHAGRQHRPIVTLTRAAWVPFTVSRARDQ